ncbi:MAG: hypothetical protein CR981_03830 [Proteobacteria bacterium]|nr:MAG: hypothetical protein CR981_03830 [Pseudomonadota bacterium]PIE65053.1 MAG: hypothetical protein CSA26_05265 [Desulfobacterales bacterium]
MRRTAGFTLFEAIVVVALVSLITAFSLPFALNWKMKAVLNGNARMFATDLQKVKTNAIRLNCPLVFLFSEHGYRVFEDSGAGGAIRGDWKQTGQEATLGEKRFSEGIRFTHNFSAQRLRFSGSGGNKAGTAVFTTGNGREITVVLSVLGRIRITDMQ